MTAAEAIATKVLSQTAVTALVGTRVRVLKFRQSETYPAVRVSRISETQPMHLRGGVSVFRTRVQVDTVAGDPGTVDAYAQARTVDEAIQGPGDGTGLTGFQGTVGTMQIFAVVPVDVRESYEIDPERVVRIMRDYEVHHSG